MLFPNYFKNFKIKIKSISHRESTVYQGVRRLYHSRTVCTDSACASPLWPVCNMNCTTLLVHCNVSTTWTRPVEFESVERVRIYFNNSVLLVHCTATKGYSSSKLWSSAVECCAQKLYVFHFPKNQEQRDVNID